jgi:phosphate-selective porin OprO/OprP
MLTPKGKEPTIMFRRLWRKYVRLLFVGGTALALLGAGSARAGDKEDLHLLKQQLEQQKNQMQQQKKLLDDLQKQIGQISQPVLNRAGDPLTGLPAAPEGQAALAAAAADRASVESIIADYLKRQDDARKEAATAAKVKAEAEGYKVGTDLGMTARWNPLNGVTFSTPNKDFVSHLGVRFQYDSVWWDQNANTRSSAQIGNLQDGTFFRRIRPSWDGQAWEVMEWNVELALEQVSNNVPTLDEVWVGLFNLPVIGSVRIGHIKVPQGFESYNSSKAQTYLERGPVFDAWWQEFGSGIVTTNSVLNQRATWAFAAYRQDNDNGVNATNNGADFQDGAYGYTGRVTGLPVYENDGRCLLHLGASYTWRNAERPNAAAGQGGLADPRVAEFQARPNLRDAIGSYGGGGLPGDSARVVSTGIVPCDSWQVIGTELFGVYGPFSVQAEYSWACMDDVRYATSINTNPTKTKVGTPLGSPWFDGGYVQVSYFLTGENRTYDRRIGRAASTYIASPYTPFWLTRGEDGRLLLGRGAWELAARWDHLNLDNGIFQGGQTDALQLGLNWYLSTNLKIQFDYLWQDRYHLKTGQVPGDINALGVRTQFFF